MNGTYTDCTNRTGNWSFAVTGTPTLDYDELSVIRGDVDCELAITEIRTTADGSLSASGPLVLGTMFGPARSVGNPISFYATAAIGSINFAAAFSISLLFSENPRPATRRSRLCSRPSTAAAPQRSVSLRPTTRSTSQVRS